MNLPHVMRAVLDQPWAILPQKLDAVLAVLSQRAAGRYATADDIRAALGGEGVPQARASIGGGVAVLPLQGLIVPRASGIEESSGIQSLQRFGAWVDEATANEQVHTLLLDVDSPGGSVALVAETWAKLMAARSAGKRVVAHVNSMAASAGYWIASAADEIVCTPSGEAGSIGVIMIHADYSKAAEAEGVTFSVLTSGKYKGEGNPYEALGDEARAAIQGRLDEFYSMFTGHVAKGRGVAPSAVRSGFGEGRLLSASAAKAAGMVDKIATFEDTLARLTTKRSVRVATRAQATAARAALRAAADPATATAPSFAVGDRVVARVDHAEGMAGMAGAVNEANAGSPPYYAIDFDEPMGMGNPHKWLTEDEIEAEPAARAAAPAGRRLAAALHVPTTSTAGTATTSFLSITLTGGSVGSDVTASDILAAVADVPASPPAVSAVSGGEPAPSADPLPEPAPKAKEHVMSETVTAAASGGANDEVIRLKGYNALRREHPEITGKLDEWEGAGLSLDAATSNVRKHLQDQLKASKAPTSAPPTPVVRVGAPNAERDVAKGFRSAREFLVAAMQASEARSVSDVSDERLRPLAVAKDDGTVAGAGMTFMLPNAFTPPAIRAAAGADEQGAYDDRYGGFAVPTSTLAGMLELGFEGDPTAGRTQNVPMATPQVDIIARTDKDHSTSVSGGFTVARRAETAAATASRTEIEKVSLKASSLFGLAYATEEILTDSPISFAAIIEAGFRDQYMHQILKEKLRGGGGNEFSGVISAACTVSVSKESGQAADTINYNNVIKMRARCWGYGNAVWLANHDCYPQLSVLSIPVGVAGQLVYQPSLQDDRPDRLLGRPIFYTEYASTIGDVGDLILGNWSQFLEGVYQPLQSAESMHVRFVNHERTFKFWMRNAGAPWWRSALTPNQGSTTLSPFVTLAARA